MGKVIAIILFILCIGFAICFNIFLYKGIKESWKCKDWEYMTFCLGLLLGEIILVIGIVDIFIN